MSDKNTYLLGDDTTGDSDYVLVRLPRESGPDFKIYIPLQDHDDVRKVDERRCSVQKEQEAEAARLVKLDKDESQEVPIGRSQTRGLSFKERGVHERIEKATEEWNEIDQRDQNVNNKTHYKRVSRILCKRRLS
jgi:hypothetical protein